MAATGEKVYIGNRRVTGGDVLKLAVGAGVAFLDPAALERVSALCVGAQHSGGENGVAPFLPSRRSSPLRRRLSRHPCHHSPWALWQRRLWPAPQLLASSSS